MCSLLPRWGLTVLILGVVVTVGSIDSATAQVQSVNPDPRATEFFHRALLAMREGDQLTAVRQLEMVVELDPEAAVPRLELATSLLRMGAKDRAWLVLEPLGEWIPEEDTDPAIIGRYYRLQAAIASLEGDTETAIELYEKTVELAPYDLALRAHLIGLYRTTGDHDHALDHLQMATMIMPQNAELYVEVGRTFLTLGRWEEAEGAFREALALAGGLEAAWYGLGSALNGQAEFERAEEVLREGLRVSPSSSRMYENLGDALLGGGQVDEAIGAYRRAAALAPENPDLEAKIDRARAAESQ